MKKTNSLFVHIYSFSKGNYGKVKVIKHFLSNLKGVTFEVGGQYDVDKPPLVVEVIAYKDPFNEFDKVISFLEATNFDIKVIITDPKTLPALTTMLKNLSKEAFKSAKRAVKGQNLVVSAEEKERRFNICKNCDKFNHKKGTCNLCGCRMRFKTRVASAKCPHKPPKW